MLIEAKRHKTRTDLARSLGFTPGALAKWVARYPDAPKSLLEVDWRAFITQHGLGVSGNRVAKSYETIRNEKTIEETKLLRIKRARLEREVISAEQVDSFLLHLSSRVKSAVYQQFCAELPPKLAGLEVAEVRRLSREAADVLCVSMQSALDEWTKEQAAAREAAATAEDEPNDAED